MLGPAAVPSISSLLPFVLGSVLVTIVPGPDMALVTRQVLAYGQRVARATIAGNILGLVVHTAGVAFGLSALLLSSARIFEVVKLAGAAYLIYLGATTFWLARRAAAATETGLPPPQRAVITRATAFRQGFLSTTLNPKPALFFATYLPQFIDPDGNVAVQILALGGFHILVGVIWLTTYAQLIGRLHFVLTRDRVRRGLERATGAVLIALGLRVAFSER
jgi:threonine/homoserine/homoserine lactone efflux protein